MTGRYVVQFSCGAASAIAAKLSIARHGVNCDVQIINAYIENEHADNRRFLADCERWFSRKITVLRDEVYGADALNVFRKRRYMKGPKGAPCSRELKRKLLNTWAQPGDVIVLGFTAEEVDRRDDFEEHFPNVPIYCPLIDSGLSKCDCKEMIARAGIELPLMYRLGYENANCIGCVKGGEGYWRAIRQDFPEQFEKIAALQEQIGEGANFLRYRHGPLKDQRFSLRELPEGKIAREGEIPQCSFFCETAEAEYSA